MLEVCPGLLHLKEINDIYFVSVVSDVCQMGRSRLSISPYSINGVCHVFLLNKERFEIFKVKYSPNYFKEKVMAG